MLKEDYTLPPDEDDPEYVEKRNRVMDAIDGFPQTFGRKKNESRTLRL